MTKTTLKRASTLASIAAPQGIWLAPLGVNAGKGYCREYSTLTNGSFGVSAGIPIAVKTGSALPMQVQYRVRKYTAGSAADYGAWKNLRQLTLSAAARKYNRGSGKPFTSNTVYCQKDSTVDAGWWLTANYGKAAGAGRYVSLGRCASSAGSISEPRIITGALTGSLTGVDIEIRARHFDAARLRHSAWRTVEIYIDRSPALTNLSAYIYHGGALYFEFTVPTVFRSSCDKVDVTAVNLLDSSGKPTARLLRDVCTPTLRNVGAVTGGYRLGFTVPKSMLSATPGIGAHLGIAGGATFGANSSFPKTVRVSKEDIDIAAPVIRAAVNDDGTLVVLAYRGDATDSIGQATCSLTVASRGASSWDGASLAKTRTPATTAKNLAGTLGSTTSPFARWTFTNMPLSCLLNITVTVSATISGYSRSVSMKRVKVAVSHFILNGKTYPGVCFHLKGDPSIGDSSEGNSDIELPAGSEDPFAVFGKGRTTEITLSGTVTQSGLTTSAYSSGGSTVTAAHNLRTHVPGDYTLRSPDGSVRNVHISRVDVSQERGNYAEVTISATEVR